jgi:hypothetical protein
MPTKLSEFTVVESRTVDFQYRYACFLIMISSKQCPRTLISCPIASIVDSRARVPRVASSSTDFTVFSNDVTLVTITCDIYRG